MTTPGAFSIAITCPLCDTGLSWLNGRTNGLLAVTILECKACERQWEVTVRLIPHGASARPAAAAERKRAERNRMRASGQGTVLRSSGARA